MPLFGAATSATGFSGRERKGELMGIMRMTLSNNVKVFYSPYLCVCFVAEVEKGHFQPLIQTLNLLQFFCSRPVADP